MWGSARRPATDERKVALRYFTFLAAMWLGVCSPASPAGTPDTVFIEELTWTEVRDAIRAGKTTVIFPTGGTEQNGPHIVVGKHNFIVKHAAESIARRLGNALVAPVLAYVPEGGLHPPTGHMRYPGTITLPNEFFMKVTEYAARSFRVSGFRDIVLIGDSGGNQKGLQAVAGLLNAEWRGTGARVHFVPDYYQENRFRLWLKNQGETDESIGAHAGIADTSQVLALNPNWIRQNRLAPGMAGASGNPARASAEYGRKALEMKIEAAVAQIQKLIAGRGR